MNDLFEHSVGVGLSGLFSLSIRALCLCIKGGKFIEELELHVCLSIQLMCSIESNGIGGDIPATSPV